MRRLEACLLALLLSCGQEEEAPPAPRTRLELLRDGGLARLSLMVDGAGGPVFLRGQRGSLFYGSGETHIASVDTTNCTVTRWWQSQDEYLDAARENRINLLHVELWNVWEPDSLFPFLRDERGRFRVQAAVERGEWDEAYFAAVRHLVEGASARGIVVVLSLFNHYNVRTSNPLLGGRPWTGEPLRAANTDTSFGLDDHGEDRRRRAAEFLRFAGGDGGLTPIGRIQKALVERLLEEISEQNVAFELLMAPWMVNQEELIDGLGLARWESWLIAQVRQKERELGRGEGVLFMVTPALLHSFSLHLEGQINSDFEVTAWKEAYRSGARGYEGWAEVAILDYTGGFAFDEPPLPEEAAEMMRERLEDHATRFPETVALFNTDGFNLRFAPARCSEAIDPYVQDLRHGWWNEVERGIDLAAYPLRWAERTKALNEVQPLGSVHFLNWSTARTSMEDLARGSW